LPLGKAEVVIETVCCAATVVIESALVVLALLESVTFTVNEPLPAGVGCPEMTPAGLKLRPVGRCVPPVRDHVYLPVPPDAVNVAV
jgi:hypothetical protein